MKPTIHLLLAFALCLPALSLNGQPPQPPTPAPTGGPIAQQTPGRNPGQRSNPGHRRDQLKLMRIAYLTQELALTPELAQRFWPVYNARQAELDALRDERRREMRSARSRDTSLTDAQAERLADLQVEWQQREAQIVANHHAKLKAVLSPQQLVRLYRAEKEFKHHAQRMQHGHHGPPAHPRGPQPAHYGQCPAPGPNGRGAVGPQGGHHRGQPGAHPRRQGNPSQQPAPPAEPGDADED